MSLPKNNGDMQTKVNKTLNYDRDIKPVYDVPYRNEWNECTTYGHVSSQFNHLPTYADWSEFHNGKLPPDG